VSENVRLSAKKLAFVEWSARTRYERDEPTQEAFAKKIGVTDRTLRRWKKLPEIQTAILERASELLKEDLPEIKGALRREAMKGSFQHIKLAFEITGEYTELQKHEHSGPAGGPIVMVNWDGTDTTD
jgi:delta 1-pyrroline-5-carboxylate dehydrogenase